MYRLSIVCLVMFMLLPGTVSAHQPRIVKSELISVQDPGTSKAFYGKLDGEPHIFIIDERNPFSLYVSVLVPDVSNARTDVSAVVRLSDSSETPIATLNAEDGAWESFYESFAQDAYLQGPEFKQDVGAGRYEIQVSSTNNDSTYVLVVGEKESFPPSEILNAYRTIPILKTDFFNKPAYEAFLTPVLGLPLFLIAALVMFGCLAYLYRRAQLPPQ